MRSDPIPAPAGQALDRAESPNGGAEAAIDLGDPTLYFDRELSWLDFNDRVLQLAEGPSTPLLERVKFCAIWETNLDEFFMVRLPALYDQIAAGRSTGDGLSARERINAIAAVVARQRERLSDCLTSKLIPALAEHGIGFVDAEGAQGDERRQLDRIFERRIFPALTPLLVGLGRPFPYISNLSLSLAVVLRDPDLETEALARVKVPKELLGRFLTLDRGDGVTFVALEDLIAANLGALFPGMQVIDHSFFRVTRDTDYDVSDEADDVVEAMEEELRRRRFGEVVRLEVAAGMSPRLRNALVDAMALSENQVYEVSGPLDLGDLWDVVGVPGHSDLRDTPYSGVTQPRLQAEDGGEADIFAAMREGDVLVHHPYDSFATSVERFVRQAVDDPEVLAIKQTVYRTSADSPLVPSLIEAAERGKQAVCMVELKARFDEQANIVWAKKLEEAGVHVVYGIPALKTHVKCVLVARREGDGVRHYAHIGTGNYNPKTARIYTDLGLFTCDQDIGSDIAEMFNYLTGYARPQRYRKVLVAPMNLQSGILEQIDRTIASHSDEHPARIRMKMNSLLDAPSIRALYRASQAGVEVDLNVRGICALRPGVAGVSENIKVRSVVGRFLEHSRIYCFERPDEKPVVLIGSGDLMPRNLYNRVELVVPVEDERVRAEVIDVLDRSLADETNTWELQTDGQWVRFQAPAEGARSVQRELVERAQQRVATDL